MSSVTYSAGWQQEEGARTGESIAEPSPASTRPKGVVRIRRRVLRLVTGERESQRLPGEEVGEAELE